MDGYFIGQEMPLETRRPIQAGDAVAWYVFQTPPQKEVSAKAWFERRGVEAWYPSEQRWRKMPRSRRKKAPYEARLVPRYVFARFTGHPAWDVVQSCRWVSRVVGIDGVPLPVSDDVMAQMAMVPERLEAIRKREVEKRTIRAGDKARILGGVMDGWVVDVSEVHEGVARFIVPILGQRETRMEVTRMMKVQG